MQLACLPVLVVDISSPTAALPSYWHEVKEIAYAGLGQFVVGDQGGEVLLSMCGCAGSPASLIVVVSWVRYTSGGQRCNLRSTLVVDSGRCICLSAHSSTRVQVISTTRQSQMPYYEALRNLSCNEPQGYTMNGKHKKHSQSRSATQLTTIAEYLEPKQRVMMFARSRANTHSRKSIPGD